MPSLYDISNFKLFRVIKKDGGYIFTTLPQPLSIEYNTNYANRTSLRKEYVIEWKHVCFNQCDLIVLCKYDMFDSCIDTEVLHTFSFNMSTLNDSIITCRCVANFTLSEDEKKILKLLEHVKPKDNTELFAKLLKAGINACYGISSRTSRGNNVNIVTIDEHETENDMDDIFVSLSNGAVKFRNGETPVIMPKIDTIYYNNPYTTIKWNDGTITTVKAIDGETFNKECGLAMAISRKYYECLGSAHPRADFKHAVNDAEIVQKKTKKLLKAAVTSTEEG